MKTKKAFRPAVNWLALAAASVLALPMARADYQSTVLADNPFAFYPLNLDVDTAGTATDVSGNGNDGAYVNIFSGFNNTNGPSAYITTATAFNGVDTSVDLSGASNLTGISNKVTLEAWVQPADSTSLGDILAKGYDSSTYQESYIRVDGPYGANYDVNLGNAGITGGQQTTNWTHVVLANDGTNTSLYLNGVLIHSKSDTVGAISFTDPWAIGNGSSSGNGRHFNGNITEVAFYTNGLTYAQVMNHYFVGLVGVPAASAKPIINVQPQSQPSYVGGSVTFSVTAVSALAMTNQWYKGSTPLLGKTNTTLTLANLQLTDAGNFNVVVGNANGTTNSTVAVLTVSTPRNLQWTVNGNNGAWDTTSTNWINLANSQQIVFNNGDAVLFDDTTGVPTTVTVSNNVVPSLVNINASANSYTLNGPNNLVGSGSLVKDGSSTLNIYTPAGFAGTVAIKGGTVYAGNNCFRSVASIAITNNATMDLGGGQFNNFTPIAIAGTGSSGQGALINTYADYPNESVSLTMTDDATLAGSARWDLATGSQVNGAHKLTIDMGNGAGYTEWNSVTVGSTVTGITLTNGNFGSKLMDTGFQNPATVFTVSPNCELSFYNGGWSGSFHIMAGATVDLWTAPAAFTGSTVILDQNAQWRSWGSSSTDEPINSAMILNGVVHCILGDHNLVYTNLVSGSGGILLDYWNHAYVFSSANTYTGPTIINDGPQVKLTGNGSISQSSLIFFGGSNSNSTHVDASSRSDSTLTLASGQTLGGIGAVAGNLVETAGATIAPAGTNTTITVTTGANPTGAITATGNITLNGTTVIKLNGSGTNDSLVAGGSVTLGGTLNLVNISGSALAAGNSFQIFQAGNGITGSFANITPAPGAGLNWSTSQLSSGIVSVALSARPIVTNTTLAGGKLIFSGTNGSASGTYYVITSTNLTTPLTSWIVVSTNSFNNVGGFSVTNAVTPGTPQQYYQIK